MRSVKGIALAVVSALILSAGLVLAQGGDPNAFWARQMAGFTRALSDPSINQRVHKIWLELVEDTRLMLPVLPAQTGNLGRAFPGGVVLDLSVAGDYDVEVTAFWLAHEYGHQALGHPQLSLSRIGQFIAVLGGTSQEDAADRWAARFLKRHGYDVEPVLEFLCNLPGGGSGDAHSTGPQRASNVATAFGGATSPCGAAPIPRQQVGRSCCMTNGGKCGPFLNQPALPIGSACSCQYGNPFASGTVCQ